MALRGGTFSTRGQVGINPAVDDNVDTRKLVVCITGPESIGKTTLAHDLADALDGTCVEEYAREYSAARDVPAGIWEDDEYLAVAAEQARRVDDAVASANGPVVCDTDGFTVWVWHRVYTVQPLPALSEFAERRASLYVMPTLEIPFIPDGIRELAWPREQLFHLFSRELVRTKRRFMVVEGSPEERLGLVLCELNQMTRLTEPSGEDG